MKAVSPESQMLLRLLEDGQWYPYEEIYLKLMAVVAPGKALRRYDTVEATRVRHHGPRKGPDLSEPEKIASGRRSIASDTFTSMRKRHVEVLDTVQGRLVRRRESPLPVAESYRLPSPARDRAHAGLGLPCEVCCGPCTLDDPVTSPEPVVAARTAPAPGPPPVVAFFSEDQVRQILAEVVRAEVAGIVDAALDRFQRGMHGFLSSRFAGVERLLYRGDAGRREHTIAPGRKP